jgi:phosphatidylglycerol---prolipoprotein diacylglyceryl transferase
MSFAVMVGLGSVLGLAWTTWRSPARQASLRLDGGLWVLFGTALGARLVFVAATWPYFQSHLVEAPQIWLGGLSWPGALGGGLFALLMFAWFNHTPLGALADGLVYLALPVTVSSWLGCWQSGCAYGAAAPQTWWSVPAVDEWGVWSSHFPLQAAAALSIVIVAIGLEWLRPHLKRPGQAASLALLVLCALLALFSLLRADPEQAWRGLRLDTWGALIFSALSIPFCLAAFWPPAFHPQPVPHSEP